MKPVNASAVHNCGELPGTHPQRRANGGEAQHHLQGVCVCVCVVSVSVCCVCVECECVLCVCVRVCGVCVWLV